LFPCGVRIAAGGAAFKEKFVFAGKAARRTADRGEKTPAMRAGLCAVTDLVSAIIAKKTGFLFQLF